VCKPSLASLITSRYSFPTQSGLRILIESLGFDRVTESSGSIFFLNQNNIVLVKKKQKSRVAIGFSTRSCRVNPPGHTGFFLPLFFLQPGPVPAPGPGSTRRAGFQNYAPSFMLLVFFIIILKETSC
jgi:hypothetical protein